MSILSEGRAWAFCGPPPKAALRVTAFVKRILPPTYGRPKQVATQSAATPYFLFHRVGGWASPCEWRLKGAPYILGRDQCRMSILRKRPRMRHFVRGNHVSPVVDPNLYPRKQKKKTFNWRHKWIAITSSHTKRGQSAFWFKSSGSRQYKSGLYYMSCRINPFMVLILHEVTFI